MAADNLLRVVSVIVKTQKMDVQEPVCIRAENPSQPTCCVLELITG